MELSRRKRYSGRGRTSVKTKKRLPINFDLSTLDLMCNYILTENRNVKRGAYINLRNLIEMLDMEKYINDHEKYKRVLFIKKGLEGRLIKGLTNPIALLKYINGGILDNDIIDPNNFVGMSNNEIDWINETVSQSLSSAFIYEDIDRALDIFTRFKTADYTSISAATEEVKEFITELNTKFRKAKVESASDVMFSLKQENFSSVIAETYKELNSPHRRLVTGMQGFNQLIGGGFENTRAYLLLGMTGIGKSLTLLNIAYQIKKYNKNFKPKDPTKTPVVVYLTMENTITETVQRLFNIAVSNEDMTNFSSPEEIERLLRTEGELYLTDESPIDIIIKFKPNRSVDTSYLYTLTEDLEDEGYEVICMIQDHVKRIRATTGQTDLRLELGDVINEMKTFAVLKDIPIITNSHLNREGARVIDSNQTRTKADLTRMLGKSNVGESLLMLDNIDGGYILNIEYDAEGNKYMVFKDIKHRFRIQRDYICQPFVHGNDIKLVEDFYSPVPAFKDSLYDTSMNQLNRSSKIKQSNYSNVINIDDDGEENIFESNASRYSSIEINEIDTETEVPVCGYREDLNTNNKKLIRPFTYVA